MDQTPCGKNISLNYISKDEKEYTIEVSTFSEKMSIGISEKKDMLGWFKITKTFDELKKISRCFRIFDKIDEIYDYIIKTIQGKKINISRNNDEIIFEMTVSAFEIKDNISFTLENKEMDDKTTIRMLCNKIRELQDEIEDLKCNQIMMYGNPKFHMSRIIKKESELDFVKENIKTNLNLNKDIKDIKFTLLFSTDTDGDEASQFHSKCDNKNNTLVLVRTKKGKRFGGFASSYWDSASGYCDDTKAFLFSLDNKECYKLNNGNTYGIYCNSGYGPTFGGGNDLYICNKCLCNCCSTNQSSYNYNGRADALCGSNVFCPEVYEVYQLENN